MLLRSALAPALFALAFAPAAAAQTFDGCGTLVQGVTCVLFSPDAGGLYVLSNLGGFPVGSHVEVHGTIDTGCITFCQQGNGCIQQNTIQPCAPGSAFCVPPVSATACPCNNLGSGGAGCANSLAGSQGALLSASGATNPDSIVLAAQAMLPTATCIFLQGDAQLAGGLPFGDGTRCVGGQLLRLAVKAASSGSASYPVAGDLSITARCAQLGAPIPPNSSRWYQTYYRDPSATFCPAPQGSTFNITNGVALLWP